MYYMMRRRENVGSVFTLDDDDEDEDALHVFLNRFDLNAKYVQCYLSFFFPPFNLQSPETGTIANLVENELFAPSLSQHAPSPPPSKGKPDTEAPRRSRRSKSRVVEVVDPPTDVPMEIVYDPPSPSRRSTSTHAEELESDDLLATAPPEGLPSRAHSASLQPHDIQESDDELDLIGSPAPESVKTISRAESVIHIIHSSSGQVVEVEADVPDGDTLDPILLEEAIVPDIAPEEVVLEEEHVVPLQEETVVALEPEADEAEFEAAQKSSEEDEMVVDEQPISPADEAGDESIAVKEVLVVEEEQDTLDKEHTEEQQQPSQEDVKMGVSEEQIPQEEGSQVEEIPPPQQHPAFEDGGELTLPSSPVISATRSPQPYQPQLPITPVTAGPAQRPVIILGPSSPFPGLPTFDFDLIPPAEPSSPRTPISPVQPRHQFNPQYTLPPLKALPVEFNRKGKPTKQQRKREKEREKNAGSEKGDGRKDKDNKDDWVPMGLNKWGATVRTNPVWKKVSRASKCLSTREWGVSAVAAFSFQACVGAEFLTGCHVGVEINAHS
jgi:chromatin modification-related protein VID21